MAEMELTDALLVIGAGFIAGVVNAMAGGGSLLTVGLLNVDQTSWSSSAKRVLSDELPQRRNYRISAIDSGAYASYFRFANRVAACL